MNLIEHDLDLWSKGYKLIAGVDEVGRGCLAGPIVTAAVIWLPDFIKTQINVNKDESTGKVVTHIEPEITTSDKKKATASGKELDWLNKINDSKKLSLKTRTMLAELIKKHALCYAIVEISNNDIDKYGIGVVNKIALEQAINKLNLVPELVLVDHFNIFMHPENTPVFEVKSITKGDATSFTIASASIIAKDYRDRLMLNKYHLEFPQYGFDKHVGYGTKAHIDALKAYGPSPIHRKSFHLKAK